MLMSYLQLQLNAVLTSRSGNTSMMLLSQNALRNGNLGRNRQLLDDLVCSIRSVRFEVNDPINMIHPSGAVETSWSVENATHTNNVTRLEDVMHR